MNFILTMCGFVTYRLPQYGKEGAVKKQNSFHLTAGKYSHPLFYKVIILSITKVSRITLRFIRTIVSPGVGIVASFFGASIIRWDMDIIIISIIIVILLFTCQGYRCKNPNCDVDVHEWCREVWSLFPQFSQFVCSSVPLPVAWTLQKWSK